MIGRTALVLVAFTNLALAEEAAPPPAKGSAAVPGGGAGRAAPVVAPTPPRQAPRPRHIPDDVKDPFGDIAPGPSRPPPPKPTAAPEIAKLGKQLAGSYRCKGVSMVGDGSSMPLEATLKIEVALDGAWIVAAMAEVKAGGVKFEDYRTYDATAKQWTRLVMSSSSAHSAETSLGEKDGKWAWEGSQTAPTGTTQVRDYEQLSGKQIKVWGEALLSGTWQKSYEATCKR